MARVEVDRDLCQGHGQCVLVAPSVFALDADGLSVPQHWELTVSELSEAQSAELICPTRAIKLIP